MTIHDYVRALREHWGVVLLALILSIATAAGVWFLRPPEYTAVLRLYVSAQSVDTAQSAYQGAQLSEQRVTSYVELASSTRVSGEVIRKLGLSATPEEVAEHITASSKVDSVIIDVAVDGTSPENVAAVANAVGEVFPRLVDELERPSSPTGTPPVAVRVVESAKAPVKPSSMGLPLTLALGLLAGLSLGVGAALTRSMLDTSVKSLDQLRDLTRAPNLGTVAFDVGVPKRPLTVHDDPQSPRAEAFRQLRTNLQFLDVDTPHRIIAITSALPSEGKTTTMANLAIALASAGGRVLAVEADLRRPKLADVLGVERAVGLTSILAGRVHPDHGVQHWSGTLDVLTSGPLPPNPSELLGSQHMALLLEEFRKRYDIVLLDTPPVLPVTDAAALAPATDGVLLVCRYKRTTRDQVAAAVEALSTVATPLLGTVFTMVPAKGPRAYAQYNSYYRTSSTSELTSPPVGNPTVGARAEARPIPRRRTDAPRPTPGLHRP